MPTTVALSPGQLLPASLLEALNWPAASCQAAILLFVRGPWCPVCRRQIGRLSVSTDELAALGVPVFVISTSSIESFNADERLGALPVRYVSDTGGELITSIGIATEHPDHGVIARPATVIIDTSGRIAYGHVGTHPRDRPEPAAIMLAVRRMLLG
jgi:peroxiredoxin